jgi:Spy/CpxP family protein refolding chaperone
MVIFGCGVVTGGLLMKTELPPAGIAQELTPHPANSTNQPPPLGQFQKPEFLRRMQKQLDLTASQRDDIAKIMKASQERTRPLWDQIAPQLRQEKKSVREEIRQVLTPDQQKKFDELLKARPRKADGAGAADGRPLRPAPESPAQTNTLF